MSECRRQADVQALVAGFRAWVEELAASGIEGFPRAPSRSAPARTEAHSVVPVLESLFEPLAGSPGHGPEDPEAELVRIREEIGDCRRCKLCHGRTNIVFGTGSPRASVMFVGEGPGEDEDRQGEPFVGRAGQLLTDIIQKGMGLARRDVYIANVVKCRPPNNRNPEPDEIAACRPFLHRQIRAIRPRVLVALGKFAAQTLLQTTTPISRLRGRWHQLGPIRIMPTFHPSYLLRNPADKALVWQDIREVMAELGLPLPKPRTRS
jgi:DNA polymerase